MEFYQKQLHQHCCICAQNLQRNKYCANYHANIEKYLGISLTEDDSTIHPQFRCNRCNGTLINMDEGRANSTTLTPFEWSAHVVTAQWAQCTCTFYMNMPAYTGTGTKPYDFFVSYVPTSLNWKGLDDSRKMQKEEGGHFPEWRLQYSSISSHSLHTSLYTA